MDTTDLNKLNLIRKNINDIGVKEKVNSYTDHVNFLISLIDKQESEINSLYKQHKHVSSDVHPDFIKELTHILKKYHLISSGPTA